MVWPFSLLATMAQSPITGLQPIATFPVRNDVLICADCVLLWTRCQPLQHSQPLYCMRFAQWCRRRIGLPYWLEYVMCRYVMICVDVCVRWGTFARVVQGHPPPSAISPLCALSGSKSCQPILIKYMQTQLKLRLKHIQTQLLSFEPVTLDLRYFCLRPFMKRKPNKHEEKNEKLHEISCQVTTGSSRKDFSMFVHFNSFHLISRLDPHWRCVVRWSLVSFHHWWKKKGYIPTQIGNFLQPNHQNHLQPQAPLVTLQVLDAEASSVASCLNTTRRFNVWHVLVESFRLFLTGWVLWRTERTVMRQSRQSLYTRNYCGSWAQCAAKPWVFFLPRIALSRRHAAHLVHPQALAAANGIFESEYLGEPQLDKDWRRDVM